MDDLAFHAVLAQPSKMETTVRAAASLFRLRRKNTRTCLVVCMKKDHLPERAASSGAGPDVRLVRAPPGRARERGAAAGAGAGAHARRKPARAGHDALAGHGVNGCRDFGQFIRSFPFLLTSHDSFSITDKCLMIDLARKNVHASCVKPLVIFMTF